MKKILCVLLTSILLLLTACNVAEQIKIPNNNESSSDIIDSNNVSSEIETQSGSKDTNNTENVIESSSNNELLETPSSEAENIQALESSETTKETDPNTEAEGCWGATIATKDYEEYLTFINTTKVLPDNFITYEALNYIGDFKAFVLYSPYDYFYIIVDQNGMDVYISIDPISNKVSTSNKISTLNVVVPNNLNDLRKIIPPNNIRDSIYINNNMSYRYYRTGTLRSITWETEGVSVKIQVEHFIDGKDKPVRLSDYPTTGEETFVSKLLSTQTATAAMQAFNQKIEAEIAKNLAEK